MIIVADLQILIESLYHTGINMHMIIFIIYCCFDRRVLLYMSLQCHIFLVQISFMEADMDKDISNILCTKVDEHAGDWPSESFLELFRIAKKCVEPKMSQRPEIDDVSATLCPAFNSFLYIE